MSKSDEDIATDVCKLIGAHGIDGKCGGCIAIKTLAKSIRSNQKEKDAGIAEKYSGLDTPTNHWSDIIKNWTKQICIGIAKAIRKQEVGG